MPDLQNARHVKPSEMAKKLIVDIFEADFFQNGRLLWHSANLTTGSIDNKQTKVDVRNGRGNAKFAVLPTNKEATVSLTENTFSFNTLALITGSDIVVGEGIGITAMEEYTLDSSKKITLKQEPTSDVELEVWKGDILIEEGKMSRSAKEITFTDLSAGDVVKVYPYTFATSAETRKVTISAKQVATGGKLILSTQEVNQKLEKVADIYFVCENVVPAGEWGITLGSEVKANDLKIDLEILQQDNGVLYDIYEVPVATA